MLVVLVWGICRRRCAVLCAGDSALLLDKNVGDEAVDDGGVDLGVGARPQHHPGGGQNLKGIQHVGDGLFEVEKNKSHPSGSRPNYVFLSHSQGCSRIQSCCHLAPANGDGWPQR